jgi:hypothetical protein
MSSSLATSLGCSVNGPDADPEPSAVDGLTQHGKGRQEQQHQAGRSRRVGVALQPGVVAHDGQHQHEADDADRRPDQLARRLGAREVAGELLRALGGLEVQSPDHDQAEPVEQRDARQDQRVGVRGEAAHREVGDEEQHGQAGSVAERAAGDPVLDGQPDRGVRQHRDQDGERREHQLRAAARSRSGRQDGGGRRRHGLPVAQAAGPSGASARAEEDGSGADRGEADGVVEGDGPADSSGAVSGSHSENRSTRRSTILSASARSAATMPLSTCAA